MNLLSFLLPPVDGHRLVGVNVYSTRAALLVVAPAPEGRLWVVVGGFSKAGKVTWSGPSVAVAPDQVVAAAERCAPGVDWRDTRWLIEPCVPVAEPLDLIDNKWLPYPGLLDDLWRTMQAVRK